MFRLHSAQRSYLTYQQHHPDAVNHYRGMMVEMTGSLDVIALQNAFNKVVERHDAMHCALPMDSEHPKFCVNEQVHFTRPIRFLNASNLPKETGSSLKDILTALNAEDFLNEPFDMDNGPLWRALLIKTAPDKYQFVTLCHPMIVDDRSMNIMFKEIEYFYNAAIDKTNASLEPIAPVNQLVNRNEEGRRQKYWQNKLAGMNVFKLNTPKTYNGAFQFHGKHKAFHISKELAEALSKSMPEFTFEQILLTALYSLAYLYSGDTDITIGSTDTNRPKNDGHINAAANWLTLRQQFDEDVKFSELLDKAAKTHSEAQAKQLTIDTIYQSCLSYNTHSALCSMSPFDVLLNLIPEVPQFNLKNLQCAQPKQLDLGFNEFSFFQLTLGRQDSGAYDGFINFNSDLLDDAYIERLLGHFENILKAAAANPDCRMSDIPVLTEEEKKLHEEFENTHQEPFFGQLMVPAIFHQVAKENPGEIALVFHPLNGDQERMTYGELEDYSNQIANYLRETCGLKKGDAIAFSITRSINLFAIILGALKAGLEIVPLETEATAIKLLDLKLSRTNPTFILTDKHTQSLFSDKKIKILNMDDPDVKTGIKSADNSFYDVGLTEKSKLYIEHSSATTTGIPKTISLAHGGLANLENFLHRQNYPKGMKVLCTALPTFDALFFDLLVAWACGGSIHFSSDEERYSPAAVERICRQEKINYAVFLQDLMTLLPPDLPLDIVIGIGAKPRENTFKEWLIRNPHRVIVNGLGHTETGICLSLMIYLMDAQINLAGIPIDNMEAYFLDKNHKICPIGVPGEMYVTGPGLAIEYVGDAELTKRKFPTLKLDPVTSKFIPCDPADPDARRFFATGDLGCYELVNGKLCLNIIGRADRTIKLCGNAIDLDGVETLIGLHPDILKLTIIPNQDSSSLVAFVVRKDTNRDGEIAKNDYRNFLKYTYLQKVAYPQFVLVRKLLTTPNGKIDTRELQKLLPPPVESTLPASPTPVDRQDLLPTLENIWKTVLGLFESDRLPHDKSFAELGGNSLALARMEIIINRSLQLSKPASISNKILSADMCVPDLAVELEPLLNTASSKATQANRNNKRSIFAGVTTEQTDVERVAAILRRRFNSKP